REEIFRNVPGLQRPVQDIRGNPSGGIKEFLAGTVGKGKRQSHAAVFRGYPSGVIKGIGNIIRKVGTASDNIKADVVPHHERNLHLDIFFQECHERTDFRFRTGPVLGRKGKKRQITDTDFGTLLHYLTDGLHPLAVTHYPREHSRLRPPPVTVHDYRYMPGKLYSDF